jgi:hypothetical protein
VSNKNFYREDWKSMAGDLPKSVYMIGSFADPINYYRSDIKVIDIYDGKYDDDDDFPEDREF